MSRSHKDLKVWHLAMALAIETYQLTDGFPPEEKFGLVSQMRRSVISVPSNIAEGASRNSKREFIRFIQIALSSLSELETQLLLCQQLGFTSHHTIIKDITDIRKMLYGLRDSIHRRSRRH